MRRIRTTAKKCSAPIPLPEVQPLSESPIRLDEASEEERLGTVLFGLFG